MNRNLLPMHYVCEITGSELITGENYRYRYQVRPVEFTDANVQGIVGEVFQEYFGSILAYNVAEFANTATVVNGYQVSNIITGFSVKPVSGFVLCRPANVGTTTPTPPDTVAEMAAVWLFDRNLIIDGACPP
tara:strand:- start:732 stop:1127 length:396 start_codon:yes stop_codon:yes gene_type:complete